MYDNKYWSCHDVDSIFYSALQNKYSLKKIQTVLEDESENIVLNFSLLFQYLTNLVIFSNIMSPMLYLLITFPGTTKVFPSVPIQSGKSMNLHLLF